MPSASRPCASACRRARTPQIGALVNQAQLDKVCRYIELGREDGFGLVTGGTRPAETGPRDGFFIRPALFDDVVPGSRLEQEEIFGPMLAVMPFRDYEEALGIANGIPLGLTASVYTRDLRTAHAFARDVEAGFVWVNDSGRHFLGTPFGGYKDSGLGREEDTDELLSYTQRQERQRQLRVTEFDLAHVALRDRLRIGERAARGDFSRPLRPHRPARWSRGRWCAWPAASRSHRRG